MLEIKNKHLKTQQLRRQYLWSKRELLFQNWEPLKVKLFSGTEKDVRGVEGNWSLKDWGWVRDSNTNGVAE